MTLKLDLEPNVSRICFQVWGAGFFFLLVGGAGDHPLCLYQSFLPFAYVSLRFIFLIVFYIIYKLHSLYSYKISHIPEKHAIYQEVRSLSGAFVQISWFWHDQRSFLKSVMCNQEKESCCVTNTVLLSISSTTLEKKIIKDLQIEELECLWQKAKDREWTSKV